MENKSYETYARVYQGILRQAVKFLNWKPPLCLRGAGMLEILPKTLKVRNYNKVLIVTDEGIRKAGLMDGLLDGLKSQGIEYFIYDGTVPNPTDENTVEAAAMFNAHQCDAIIGFGGGSPLDCAKGAAVMAEAGHENIRQYHGLLKVRRKLPPVIAVPTTAGTGSEGTIATVITDTENKTKYAIMDPALRPEIVVLDATLTTGLPREITAHTGMDAVSHVVEAYINQSNTKATRSMAEEAIRLIFQNLPEAYHNGKNKKARDNMQYGAYLAGRTFTRGYVGNIHAMAHQIGAKYPVTHGEANAVIMPYVLEEYGPVIHEDLARLSDAAGISEAGETVEEKAQAFISSIRDLNASLGIRETILEIEEDDLDEMVDYSFAEANPLYPVPVIFTKGKFRDMYLKVKNGPQSD
ncbi:iron-containing alcohol dehydrogenase [Lacicoccus alkaliphilus]|uniref:Alcohol dehydrogenase, class IV n=1 Tax=Lacicoccus alkaliphilus DSM 16010 TaxID=1123231 RepID=A0A1M7JQU6_9BACL|nr:iron-containing alcohol dehydrogenase [Salinicoccus alkaliphilus]SHM55285.1 Alcohol dehydrogenase, class IV [Salinicoccus alkaliphilus DSM 16010]